MTSRIGLRVEAGQKWRDRSQTLGDAEAPPAALVQLVKDAYRQRLPAPRTDRGQAPNLRA